MNGNIYEYQCIIINCVFLFTHTCTNIYGAAFAYVYVDIACALIIEPVFQEHVVLWHCVLCG